MEKISRGEHYVLKEMESIRNIIYGHDSTDPGWIKNIRPYKLALERDELIRNFVISRHLLVDGFLDVAIRQYFIKVKYPMKSRRIKNFMSLLEHLSFYEKVEYAKRLNSITAEMATWLRKLNQLRNRAAHDLFLGGKVGKLQYENEDLLTLPVFERFANRQFEIEHQLAEHLFGSRESGE